MIATVRWIKDEKRGFSRSDISRTSSDVMGLSLIPAAILVMQDRSSDAKAAMGGRDGLGNGGHAHRVGAEAPRHLYVLAGYTKEALDSSEASLKYIIYGAVASGVMLYGISILFGLTGSVGFSGINHALAMGVPNYLALLLAMIFIFVGFGFKISAVPFHFWTPDVYEGAPITITALLSVASKSAGLQ